MVSINKKNIYLFIFILKLYYLLPNIKIVFIYKNNSNITKVKICY